jgi:hypothetical protein
MARLPVSHAGIKVRNLGKDKRFLQFTHLDSHVASKSEWRGKAVRRSVGTFQNKPIVYG